MFNIFQLNFFSKIGNILNIVKTIAKLLFNALFQLYQKH